MPEAEGLERLVAGLGEDADVALRTRLTALAADMAEGGTGREEPVREIFGLLGDRWSTLILLILATGRYRHAALRRTVSYLGAEQNISQRMLTLKLQALLRNGLISRRASDDVPPRVDYELTPLGRQLVEQAQGLIKWIKLNRSSIDAARTAHTAMQRQQPP